MVILDPAWNMKSLQNHQGSKLRKVLMSLPSKLIGMHQIDAPDQVHPLSILQPSVEHTLITIVEAVAGEGPAKYVNDFLDEFSPQFRIPHDPSFDWRL